MYASMRNTETCAIMPRLILEMRGIARIAGTAGGVNRTHKRTLARAKSRHIVSLLCRKNPVFSLKKPYITLHLLWRNLCILNIDFLTHFYIKNLCFLRHIIVVSLWKIASRGLPRRSPSVMWLYQTHSTDKAEIDIVAISKWVWRMKLP